VHQTYLAEEPSDQVTENNSFIGLFVGRWRWNTSYVPQVGLPLVHVLICCFGVDEQNARCTLYQPPAIQDAYATVAHRLNALGELGVRRLELFYLDSSLEVDKLAQEQHDNTTRAAEVAGRRDLPTGG